MQVAKTFDYLYKYYINPGLSRNKYILPTHVNFPITDNCNSKCQMCNVWKDKSVNELKPEEIAEIFSDKLFVNAQHLGISGGEPTLRKDLLECVESIVNSLSQLKSLSITSHGFHPTKWKRLLPQIKEICNKKQVNLSINISVDGIGDLHNEVRRVENGWEKVLQSIQVVQSEQVTLQLQSTISKHNVYGVNEILHYAKSNNIDIVFRKATEIERLYNNKITNEFFTSNPENSFFADFLQSDSLVNKTTNPARRLFYKDLSGRLVNGQSRSAPCHFQYNGVLISAHGDMSHCSIDNVVLGNCRDNSPYDIYFSENTKVQLENLLETKCKSCLHDQSGSWSPVKLIREELGSKFNFLSKIQDRAAFFFTNVSTALSSNPRGIVLDPNITNRKVHIIGAYGGEHVGDSAILGGVIHRLLGRFEGIHDFIVYSKRADRTRFWIKGLDFPEGVQVSCKDYDQISNMKIGKEDVLVWAGGPIMEMPKDLLEHYRTIKSFTKRNPNFEIIGCGWGPFKTGYSRSLAQKILNNASYVQMRDVYNINVDHDVARDPAFDYISYQSDKSIKGFNWNRTKSEEFLNRIRDKGFKKFLLINLRPMWSKYNKSDLSLDDLHNLVKERIFEIIKKAPKDVAVVSVPFNTDHYGFSDMELAMEINDRCKKEEMNNYFVFNRELNARDLIWLLRNFHYAICMRFHACIFMKSLNIPVYGIDYTAGEKGKVGGLFDSFNDTNYSNVLDIKTSEIQSFIDRHS